MDFLMKQRMQYHVKQDSIDSRPKVLTPLLTAFSIVGLVSMLSACGGGSNNLPDPNTTATTTTTSCVSTSTSTCVNAEFVVDGPVAGLNYTCPSADGTTVNNVTDQTGGFSCEDESTVTFFLKGTGGKTITLGTWVVQSDRNSLAEAQGTLVSITPLNLVSGATNAATLGDTAASGAVNIAQLLETLRSPTSIYNANEPTSRLIIDSSTSAAINSLKANIPSSDVTSGTYATVATGATASEIQPVLDALAVSGVSRPLVTTAKTITELQQGLQALQAGSYFSNPGFSQLSSLGPYATLAANSSNSTDNALLGLYNVIDRSGFAIGQGAEWNGSIAPPSGSATSGVTNAFNLLTDQGAQFTRLALNNGAINSPTFLNSVNNFMADTNYSWQPEAVALNSANFWQPTTTTTPLGSVTFSNGRLIGQTYVVSTDSFWQGIMNNTTTTVPSAELASWVQSNKGIASYYNNGTLLLEKIRSVSPFLDPAVFRTAANVAGTSNAAIFPLYATLTFTYTGGSCPTATGCSLGTQGIAILANGNIITDMKQDCSAVDPTTLISGTKVQQYRIGLVGAVFQGVTNTSSLYVSPIIMLSGHQFDQTNSNGLITGTLDGIQIGTLGSLGASLASSIASVKINVASVPSGSVSMSDNTATTDPTTGDVITTGEQSTAPAAYSNFYDSWVQVQNGAVSTNPVTVRSSGYVSIALEKCYATPTL